MSPVGTPGQLPEVVRGLLDQWVAGLAQVVESMADQKPENHWQPGAAPAADQDLLWWEQPFQLGPAMRLWVATPHPTWEYAGTLTLKAAGLETVETAEARNTWLEILGQSLSGLALAIGGVLSREVACEAGTERAPDAMPEMAASVTLSFGETTLVPLWIGFSAPLISVICSPAAGQPEAAPEDAGGEPHTVKRNDMPPTMELLLDVELPVSISFGKTEILMKDVLKLTTGSIVELNRGVNEPVEVLVNHCLIARGEVVVVEGNYGVRIQQIVNRQDRLRSIR
uniref:Flagellar motor switch protein FliN n=1 Tax=Solibacter usitatus (strain Ellin6076) TaxID=234267 RepID=Q01PP4_SOLUE